MIQAAFSDIEEVQAKVDPPSTPATRLSSTATVMLETPSLQHWHDGDASVGLLDDTQRVGRVRHAGRWWCRCWLSRYGNVSHGAAQRGPER